VKVIGSTVEPWNPSRFIRPGGEEPVDSGNSLLFRPTCPKFPAMSRLTLNAGVLLSLIVISPPWGAVAADEKDDLVRYQAAGLAGGEAARGREVFESKEAGCRRCHAFGNAPRLAGPDLSVVGDKLARIQLVQSVLEPSAQLHPDYGTLVVRTSDGKTHSGVLRQRTREELQLYDAEGNLLRFPTSSIEEETRSATSLMPAGLWKNLSTTQFANLIAWLESLRQTGSADAIPGLPRVILPVRRPAALRPLHHDSVRFDNPVWIHVIPGRPGEYVVCEQKTRKVWRFDEQHPESKGELFVDLTEESTTGEFDGVVCLAFHPDFANNRRYFVKYHLRDRGSFFSPVIVERQATADLSRDAGQPSRTVLQIHQATDLHWGGMIAFGPDGYLYIGAGDAGPQDDPEGHGQALTDLHGAILRIDVDRRESDLGYAIPEDNPYRDSGNGIRREIWASGYRNPWRFSFDSQTKDLWIGDIGQNLFEEVSICRRGENHGWNVYEGFVRFSDQYQREGVAFTPPIFSYRREYGVSVTGGYVYRGEHGPSYVGTYICGDFESRRLWALTQEDRKLNQVRQIGTAPQRIASFGLDHSGDILVVGYEGTLYRLDLTESDFQEVELRKTRVNLRRAGVPTAARITVLGRDDLPYAPRGVPLRKSTSGESYFYASGSFEVESPPGATRIVIRGGLETIPQSVVADSRTDDEVNVELRSWIDLPAEGWFAGDSHVHLHTGGPIDVTVRDALLAAEAEGVHYVNLCVSNNVGDDIRDAGLITGRPHPGSRERHLLVFGEEMRSMIYGHMQFFGIHKLVEPQYTGFDNNPLFRDYQSNYTMAAEATRQGGVVTYGHPLFTGQPFPFEDDLAKPNGAARELPVDAMLGVVQAIDLMSYNSDEAVSTELWYRLLNCGVRLAACVGTDALLDRSTDPLGGDRVYVKLDGPLTMENWLAGLKQGRTIVSNGPIPRLLVNGTGPGGTIHLPASGEVKVAASVESLVPIDTVEVIQNGLVVGSRRIDIPDSADQHQVRLNLELPVLRSGWIALRASGPRHKTVFDGPAWAHTSPVYISVGDQPVTSHDDASFFVDWIEKLIQVLSARNRFEKVEDRHSVEGIFRKAQDHYRKQLLTR